MPFTCAGELKIEQGINHDGGALGRRLVCSYGGLRIKMGTGKVPLWLRESNGTDQARERLRGL